MNAMIQLSETYTYEGLKNWETGKRRTAQKKIKTGDTVKITFLGASEEHISVNRFNGSWDVYEDIPVIGENYYFEVVVNDKHSYYGKYAEAAKDFSVVKEGLKKAGKNHYYTVNGEGKYSPYQLIEKYIKFKLDEGTPFNKILRKDDGSPITHIGPSFISTNPGGVTYNRARGEEPYSFNYLGQDYYISTQLRDKDPKCNVWAFRVHVNKTEPHFQIEVI